jgi:hypothetical protein
MAIRYEKPCWRCGYDNHLAANCQRRDNVCPKCNRRGHVERCCDDIQEFHAAQSRNQEESQDAEERETSVSSLHSSQIPFSYAWSTTLNIEIEGAEPMKSYYPKLANVVVPVKFDNGSERSLLTRSTFLKFPSDVQAKLQQPKTFIIQYDATLLKNFGVINVPFEIHGFTFDWEFQVVEGPNDLIGRDVLEVIPWMYWNPDQGPCNLQCCATTAVSNVEQVEPELRDQDVIEQIPVNKILIKTVNLIKTVDSIKTVDLIKNEQLSNPPGLDTKHPEAKPDYGKNQVKEESVSIHHELYGENQDSEAVGSIQTVFLTKNVNQVEVQLGQAIKKKFGFKKFFSQVLPKWRKRFKVVSNG